MTKRIKQDLSKQERIFQILNLSLNIVIVAFLIFLAIYYFATNNARNRQYACLGLVGFSSLPLVCFFAFRNKIPNYLYLFVNIYIIFAGVWGSAFLGYKTYWWFDIVIHTFMGYFAGVIALYFLCARDEERKMKVFTVALFCLCFALFIEALWELFEFGVDLIAPTMEMQGINVLGSNFPLVADTMLDILCNFAGAFVFFLQYIIAKKTSHKFGINAMRKEFTKKQN